MALAESLEDIRLGEAVTFRNVTMYPMFADSSPAARYRTLDEALEAGTIAIQEVSEGGSVSNLSVTNAGATPALLMDGEELVGAKQNRVLNVTVLVAAYATVMIPVSCVEAGRWRYRSIQFASSPRAQYASGRAQKMEQVYRSMKEHGSRVSDQGAIWADIDEKAARMRSSSPTSAMADIYEQHRVRVEDYVRGLPRTEGAAGALFTVNGNVVGFDLFDGESALRRLYPKLVRSVALDAIEASASAEPNVLGADDARAFLREVVSAPSEVFPAVGLGEEVRIAAERLTGAGLVCDEGLVHLSAFRR